MRYLAFASPHRRPLDWEMLLFLLASAADVFLTYLLLHGDGPWVFVETNPVAGYFLSTAGFPGMVAFKVLLVSIVAVNCYVISRHRPKVALGLIRFADAAVLAVVGYSSFLLWQYA